jgi:BolA family transcriptional regulator, general stress-responsive regulator
MNSPRYDMIRDRLSAALAPTSLQVVDDSHLHVGHAGAEGGRGHYRVAIVSMQFAGLRSIARHQLVYRALGDLMQTDIHALSIRAMTPDEAALNGGSQ